VQQRRHTRFPRYFLSPRVDERPLRVHSVPL